MRLETQPARPDLLAGLGADAAAVLAAVGRYEPYAYLVGGTVRDLLLGVPGRDVDVVIAGAGGSGQSDPRGLALRVRDDVGGRLVCHEGFLTCTLTLPSVTLDLAAARTEHYARPGALPTVTPGTLQSDLYRRDFSVNTFAVGLAEPDTLLSVPGATGDLEHRLLRTLHDRSFFDDPTRIVRGARLAGRLGFGYDPTTRQALKTALAAGVHRYVSPDRLKNELFLTLAEPNVAPAITNLAASGALDALYGLADTPLIAKLDTLRADGDVADESYLLALLLERPDNEARTFVKTFGLPERVLAVKTRLQTDPTDAKTLSERAVVQALGVALPPDYPRVRGSDVLSLGLPAGPEVGRVLNLLERARRAGRVASFADELTLAERLVTETLTQEKR